MRVSQGFGGTKEHWQNIKGIREHELIFGEQADKTLQMRGWKHGIKEKLLKREQIRKTCGNIRKFWRGTKEQGTPLGRHPAIAFPQKNLFWNEKNDSDYVDLSARLAELKILARFENTGLGFLARADLRAGLNPSPCNRQFDFNRTCSRSRTEISARDEIRNVIRPLDPG